MNRRTPSVDVVPQGEVPRLYDRMAGVYDLWGHLAESRARARSLSLAGVQNGHRVLDVATGTGLAFVDVVRRNPDGRNVGIDISDGMLTRARQRLATAALTNFELRLESALDIREPDEAFDRVLISYLFDLLEEQAWSRVLHECRRILASTGTVVMVNMTVGERPGSHLYEGLYRLSPRLMGGCRGVRLAPLLETSGFVVRTREYVQQLLFPSEIIVATKHVEGAA